MNNIENEEVEEDESQQQEGEIQNLEDTSEDEAPPEITTYMILKDPQKSIFPNRVKKITTILIIVMSLVSSGIGGFIFYQWYSQIKDYKLDGGKFLPEFKLNFESFSLYMEISSYTTGGVLFFGLIAAYFKKPITAVAFFLTCISVGTLLYSSSELCNSFAPISESVRVAVCVNSTKPELVASLHEELLNKWMCTSDCKCNLGNNNETIKLWQSYGDEKAIWKFKRNTGDKNKINNQNQTTYPFKWSANPAVAMEDYRSCYQKVLKPQNKLKGYENLTALYFDGGIFDFLISLEDMFQECSSICKQSLFYLSKPTKDGMPKKECIQTALDQANALAKGASSLMFVDAIIIFVTSILAIPVCTDYNPDEPEELPKLEEETNIQLEQMNNEDKTNNEANGIGFEKDQDQQQSGDRGLKVSAAKDDEEEAQKTIKITTDVLGVTPSK